MALMRPRAVLAGSAALLIVLAGCTGEQAPDKESATGPLPDAGNMLLVMRGDGDVQNRRLRVDDTMTEWFTDRPQRKAGLARAGDLAKSWNGFGFGKEPPNAAVAGDGVDAIVELTAVKSDGGSTTFAFRPIRGRLGQGRLGSISLFIDGTGPVHPTMRVRAFGSWCARSRHSRLSNPQVVRPPATFYVPPVQRAVLGDRNRDGVINQADRVLLFMPRSLTKRSNFVVRYEVSCMNRPKGTVTLSGSVPAVWYNPKHFACRYTGRPIAGCYGYPTGKYHPSGFAVIGRTR